MASGGTFNFPVLRLGHILVPHESIDFSLSQKIASKMETKAFWEQLQKSLKGSLQNLSSDVSIKICKNDRTERPKRISANFPIISYPSIIISIDDFKFKVRNAVTVCYSNFKHKIWNRVILLEYKNEPAYNLSYDVVDSFFHQAKEVLDNFSQETIKAYSDTLNLVGNRKKAFQNVYSLTIFNLNSNDMLVKEFFSKLRQMEYSTLKEFINSNEKCLMGLQDYFHLVFQKKHSSKESLIKSIMTSYGDKNFEWKGFDSIDFNTLVAIEIQNDNSRLVGIGFNDDTNFSSNIPSCFLDYEASDFFAKHF